MSSITPLAVAANPVWRDFLPVLPEIGAPELFRVVILDNDISPDILQVLPDATSWRDPSLEDPAQVLLLTTVSITAVDVLIDDLPRLHVELSSMLQDLVMDARNTVWPVVRTKNGESAVAEPMLINGRACWVEHGRAVVDIGRLVDVVDNHN